MPDIDDPFVPNDLTQRPRPGGRRAPGVDPAAFGKPAQPYAPVPEPVPPHLRALLGVGLNPLVQAASPLLLLAGQLRGSLSSMDVAGLRRYALDEVRRFEEQARTSGVQNEIILAARYALCACLDEAVQSTPWGAQSEWAQHPLLVALHREAWGGEKFFEMLERISADPARHLDLMELQYLGLALGFTGKYQQQERGHERLAALQQELYRKILLQRGAAVPNLSLKWRGLEDRRNRLVRYVPWWVIGALAIAILTVAFLVYRARLTTMAEPIQARLTQIGMDDVVAAPPAPVVGPTLKQLLAAEEASGTMTVRESGVRTTITLPSGDLFKSGSAVVNPSYEAALGRLAAALNRVPGRVTVVGHTDDQPIRSLQFHDNYELSRERAVSVANILKQTLTSPGRLTWNGVGASQPLGTAPEDRARNRRVEILHVRG